jgi:hypothetical protein
MKIGLRYLWLKAETICGLSEQQSANNTETMSVRKAKCKLQKYHTFSIYAAHVKCLLSVRTATKYQQNSNQTMSVRTSRDNMISLFPEFYQYNIRSRFQSLTDCNSDKITKLLEAKVLSLTQPHFSQKQRHFTRQRHLAMMVPLYLRAETP